MSKSRVYKVNGKRFRYDYGHSVVEYVGKADDAMWEEEIEWKAHHGHPLFGIDSYGYYVIDSAGLSVENWKNKEVRDEYLTEWGYELAEEARRLFEAEFC